MSRLSTPISTPLSAQPFRNQQTAVLPEGLEYSQFEAMLRESTIFTRTTVGNSVLTYVLNVIQQPERARACGSEAKSVSDRRVIDPPPAVTLLIFELKNGVQTDISFSYDANFFLFATLEASQALSHGEIHLDTIPPVPILTGMPAATSRYLDRPHEGIFFTFPDLSVRREGVYRLCFSLYENTKNPQNGDQTAPEPNMTPIQDHPKGSDGAFDFRTEIKSDRFLVYSAKKFPGLAGSTPSSRTLAEQGCRIRIMGEEGPRRGDSSAAKSMRPDDQLAKLATDELKDAPTFSPPPSPLSGDRSFARLRGIGIHLDENRDHGFSSPFNADPYPPSIGRIEGEDGQTFQKRPTISEQLAVKPENDSRTKKPIATYPQVLNQELVQAQEVYHNHSLERFGQNSDPKMTSVSNQQLSLPLSAETNKAHISDEFSSTENLMISKAEIWSTFLKCWEFEAPRPPLEHASNETAIIPVNVEPLSHTIKRSSQEWWLTHASEPWESILPVNDKWPLMGLARRIFSSWHQDGTSGPCNLLEEKDWMLLSTKFDQGYRVVEQLVHDIFAHLRRAAPGSVKCTTPGNSTMNAPTGCVSTSQQKSHKSSGVTGKRRGRYEAEEGDDELDGDEPNQNDRTKRVKKTTNEYNRYVICPQFAAGQEPARPNCFFGAWCSVDRLKQDHLINVHKFNASDLKIDRGGTEADKWWRLFDKLNPGFRESNPDAFIPGPFWEDRVAHNTYNKVFSEAMKRAESIQERLTQRLASDIQGLLHRQRDVERQEIRQVVRDVLHAGSRDTSSSTSLTSREMMDLEFDNVQHAGGTMRTPNTSILQQPDTESTTSTAFGNSCPPTAPQTTTPEHTSSSSELSLYDNPSYNANQHGSSLWQLTQDDPGVDVLLFHDSSTPPTSNMLGAQYDADLNMTTTSSSETTVGTLSAEQDFDIEQPFGKVCRCRFHSAECDHGVGDGHEWCACCSGWFPWSAFAEPFIVR